MEFFLLCFGIASIGSAIYVGSHLGELYSLRKEIIKRQSEIEALSKKQELDRKENEETLRIFRESILNGRKWLCDLFAKKITDEDTRDNYLRWKKYPAKQKTQEVVKQIKEEKRELISKNLFLESQIQTYQEYFPFLKHMEEEILEETINIQSVDLDSDYDRTKDYLSQEEYKSLSECERNQRALNKFLKSSSKRDVGMLYELYLGYLYEHNGYKVTYYGVENEYNDLGRDLICKKGNETIIVQAKCWAKDKEVHENAVCQLFGTTIEYKKSHPKEKVTPVLYLQCRLSERGFDFANSLGIKVEQDFRLEKNLFPLIKCNISSSGEKIYHLPFDQQYRRTKVTKPGEFMAFTVKEAVDKGFRRAFRWKNVQAQRVPPVQK